jgi:hypothetical protein
MRKERALKGRQNQYLSPLQGSCGCNGYQGFASLTPGYILPPLSGLRKYIHKKPVWSLNDCIGKQWPEITRSNFGIQVKRLF